MSSNGPTKETAQDNHISLYHVFVPLACLLCSALIVPIDLGMFALYDPFWKSIVLLLHVHRNDIWVINLTSNMMFYTH
jgi:hypothetical protein